MRDVKGLSRPITEAHQPTTRPIQIILYLQGLYQCLNYGFEALFRGERDEFCLSMLKALLKLYSEQSRPV